jgi:hypothetical protein
VAPTILAVVGAFCGFASYDWECIVRLKDDRGMKRVGYSVFLLATLVLVVSTGCRAGRTAAHVANAGKIIMMRSDLGPTVTQTTGQHLHQINAVIEMDQRALFNDLDLLFQTERPTRLTRWTDK